MNALSRRRHTRRSLLAVAAASLLGAGGLVVLATSPASASIPCGTNGVIGINGSTVTCTYTTVGADTFTVPPNDNITSVVVVVVGGGGAGGSSTANGPGNPVPGGNGATVTNLALAATAGDVETVNVGGGGHTGTSSNGGGASSSVNAGGANQIIAGGGGAGGEDYAGGNAGSPGTNPAGLCSAGGGGAGSLGVGGAAGGGCDGNGGPTVPLAGGNGNGGPGGNGRENGATDGPGGAGSGSGGGGSSSDFSGGGGGGYGGGGGGDGGGGGGGGGSTGGTVTLATNGGTSGAIHAQTPGGPGGPGSVTISYQLPPPPTNNTPPTISGTGADGQTLTCNTSAGDWTGNPDEFSYEFLHGGTVLQGPSIGVNTYLLSVANAGQTISCSVIATNNGGPSGLVGSSNSISIPPLPTNSTLPTISGTGLVGNTLTCNSVAGDWTNSPTSFTFEFFNGASSLGAASATDTLSLIAADAGDTVTCKVIATNAGGPSAAATSSNSIAVTASLTITGPSPTIDYGGVLPALTPIYTGLVNGDVQTTTPPTCTATPAAPTNAGAYPVTCGGAVDASYTIAYAAGTLTINQVPLSVTAPSTTVLDGQPVPALVPHYSGFVGSDSPASLTTAPTCTTTYNPGSFPLPLPGPYPITCTGAVDGNYAISYVAGTLTVHQTAIPGAYVLAGPDGGAFALGNPGGFHGSLPGMGITVDDIVAIVSTPDNRGYWMVGFDGGTFAFGDAHYWGSLPGMGITVEDVVGMVATPDGGGYWLVDSQGGVYAFGDAPYLGSLPGLGVSVDDVVGIAATPDGGGYWLAEGSGPVEHFGDAPPLPSAPTGDIVSITAAQAGAGYWLASGSGGVFNYGDAPFEGSIPGLGISVVDVVSLLPSPNGGGYVLFGADGATFAFPNAVFPGALAGGLAPDGIVGAAPTG